CKLVRGVRQESEIRADGGEETASFDIVLSQLHISGQNSGRGASVFDPANRIVDRLDDLGVSGFAEIPKGRRKIARPDEHAVDAVHPRDLVEVLKPALRFHLQKKADLLVRGLVVSFYPAIS